MRVKPAKLRLFGFRSMYPNDLMPVSKKPFVPERAGESVHFLYEDKRGAVACLGICRPKLLCIYSAYLRLIDPAFVKGIRWQERFTSEPRSSLNVASLCQNKSLAVVPFLFLKNPRILGSASIRAVRFCNRPPPNRFTRQVHGYFPAVS